MYSGTGGFEEEDLELYGGTGPSLERPAHDTSEGDHVYAASDEYDDSNELDEGSVEGGGGEDGEGPFIISTSAALAAYAKKQCIIDMGESASWSVSTAKHGNGVEMLIDGNPETFWQSDGGHPHTITIQFPKLTSLSAAAVLLNHSADESYTPRSIVCIYGTHDREGHEIIATVAQPNGWLVLEPPVEENKGGCFGGDQPDAAGEWGTGIKLHVGPIGEEVGSGAIQTVYPARLGLPSSTTKTSTSEGGSGVWCNFVKIVVEENHDNGRDTHIRGIRLFTSMEPWSTYTTKRFFSEDTMR